MNVSADASRQNGNWLLFGFETGGMDETRKPAKSCNGDKPDGCGVV